MTTAIARLGADHPAARGLRRPTPRILQFGEGNFLRAFFDWKVDRLNERADGDWGVVIVRPIAGGNPASLNEQDGLYTVISRGVDETGEAVSDSRLVACVRQEVRSHGEWDRVLDLARNPDITVVVSNTTDAGIAYAPAVAYHDSPPASFPAKLTRVLHERWRHAGGAPDAGLQMIACELIDRNGEELRRIVLRHADEWGLGPAFITWVKDHNAFYNTLVDRIVPGFPAADADALRAELGYDDRFMTTGEAFHLFVIERKPGMPALRLPLAEHESETIVTEDVTPYKARKVAILNGAHTALCPLAMLAGVETVGEAVRTPAGARFLDRLLSQEIIPFLDLPKADLEDFAAAVLRRFRNPYIRHLWHDISLNGLVKVQTRALDRLLAYTARFGRPAPLLTLSLAAWLLFYLGRFPNAATLPARDSEAILARVRAIGALDDGTPEGRQAMVGAFLAEPAFWGRSMDEPALRTAVLDSMDDLSAAPFSVDRLSMILDR
ncbi:tagaturonate reductase [Roseospira visakhapatnamensis]|uniref:Tagaturonate reductase n=1 Tax=Roseospira visakhapatnamensis TaxID=390880 RepID=A0A7W6RCB6_9PROT|nr:tagaturonate reductase [Roseospira visakhapatnamensis]MBB4265785.1 tagaturonate reductase [Roseospira visakhapatnamensis]